MQKKLNEIIQQVGQVVLGKQPQIQLALVSILAKGHLLIEDIPGMGKTTLAHTLAQVLGLQFQRIQFTADLLPADVLGTAIFNRADQQFHFHAGPIFSHIVLADEINRATPKAQSALLEAMEERQVSIEGETRKLPDPFFVIATQNPQKQLGTYPLPESQLDRFFMRIQLGYPEEKIEHDLLMGSDRRELINNLPVLLQEGELKQWQQLVESVHVSETLVSYVLALLKATRHASEFGNGLSPRAGQAIIKAGKAWAALNGRQHVLPDDIQAIFVAVAAHRLHLNAQDGAKRLNILMSEIAVPE